jgi:hypothetical protein
MVRREWIREVGAEAAESGNYDAPEWVVSGSSEPVDADNDGVIDGDDNCPDASNVDQNDLDGPEFPAADGRCDGDVGISVSWLFIRR